MPNSPDGLCLTISLFCRLSRAAGTENRELDMENSQQILDDQDRSLPWKLIPRTILALPGAAITPAIIILIIGLGAS